MSAYYHPVYLLDPDIKTTGDDSDDDLNIQATKKASRPSSGRQLPVASKRQKNKHYASRSSRASKGSGGASLHYEDEKRSSSEERYTKRKGDKLRKKDGRRENKTVSHDEDSQGGSVDPGHPSHQDLYCQKSSSSSWEDGSFSYIAGTMYRPTPTNGDVGRYASNGTNNSGTSSFGWSLRGPVCKPRFWKFLFLVVVLLMMAQFSLNILFYRNYDSLFYVNVTSAESLSSFESRVRWVSSKLPWVHSTSEKPATVIPLHTASSISSSAPLLIGGKEVKDLTPGDGKEVPRLLRMLIEADKRKQEMQEDSAVPSDKIPDEGGGNVSASTEPKRMQAVSKSKEPTKSVNISRSNVNASSASPSKIPNHKNKQHATPSEIAKSSSSLLSSPNATSIGEAKRVLLSKEKSLCPPVPPKLVGTVKINRTVPSLEEQERMRPELEPGGRFRPAECRARHRVAVIVPYRDRVNHLSVFIYHVHPILQRQQIDYAIYIVEQAGSGKFNRAMLLNVGALEALKQYQYDCFIFHDVDLLPEDDKNLYTCPEQPRHMSIAIDSMGYKLPYNDIFGGVSAMTAEQFRTVNGFSNKFWGWGGEDDDMSNRIKFHGFFISRYPANIGRYTMLSHRKDEPNPRRYQYLYDGKKRFKSDGLNSAKYKALDVQLRRLYTWVYVDLYPS